MVRKKEMEGWTFGTNGAAECAKDICKRLGLSEIVTGLLASKINEDLSKSTEVVKTIKDLNSFFLCLGCNSYYTNFLIESYFRSKSASNFEQLKNRIHFLLGKGYTIEEILDNIDIIYASNISVENLHAVIEFSKKGDINSSLKNIKDIINTVEPEKIRLLNHFFPLKTNKKCEYYTKGALKVKNLIEAKEQSSKQINTPLGVRDRFRCSMSSDNILPNMEQITQNIYFALGRGYDLESIIENIGLFIDTNLNPEILYSLFEKFDDGELSKIKDWYKTLNNEQIVYLFEISELRESPKLKLIEEGKKKLSKSKK